jgi:hypothetical protein
VRTILRTEHLSRCITTLEVSLEQLRQTKAESIQYEILRNAVVKGFELVLETSGNLLRKALKNYMGTPRKVDELTFKELFRFGAKHGLLDPKAVERWFEYRENRNVTTHDYGSGFAEETLALLPRFLQDARALEQTLREKLGHAEA